MIPKIPRIFRIGFNLAANLLDYPVVVLLYHRVTQLDTDPQLLAVTPSNFRAQIKFLRDNFPILRFEEDWSQLSKPSVAITFDDGYADNLLEALPILEEFRVPAAFFVSTGTIGTNNEFWWDELERLIFGQSVFPAKFELNGQTYPTTTDSDRQALYRNMHVLLKPADPHRRANWLSQLRTWVGAGDSGRASHRAMTVAELRMLVENPWATIGAHTITHPYLSAQTPELQRKEIGESKRQLEAWLERKISVFSYPFGNRQSYNSDSLRLCKEIGFTKAAANFSGPVHSWSDPYQIPRQLVRNWTLDIFIKKMSGFWLS